MREAQWALNRRQFSTRRLLATVALLAMALGLLLNFGTGSAPIFFLGTVGSAVAFGAGFGMLFHREKLCALLGALGGGAFFLFAVVT